MFRDGQYLEVIKASDNCSATAIVTVQEKIIEFKKKRVSTNKWLDFEDWAAIYKILEKAVLRNNQNKGFSREFRRCEWKKFIRKLEITYTFEPPDYSKDIILVPTIKVNVSPATKKTEKMALLKQLASESKNQDPLKKSYHRDSLPVVCNISKKQMHRNYKQNEKLHNIFEEYVPDAPDVNKSCTNFEYVPSKKSTLENMQIISEEYIPMHSNDKSATEVTLYTPNFVETTETSHETHKSCAASVTSTHPLTEYITNTNVVEVLVEEYQPNFTSKPMQFDVSYVPSNIHSSLIRMNKFARKNYKLQSQQHEIRHKNIRISKEKTQVLF